MYNVLDELVLANIFNLFREFGGGGGENGLTCIVLYCFTVDFTHC